MNPLGERQAETLRLPEQRLCDRWLERSDQVATGALLEALLHQHGVINNRRHPQQRLAQPYRPEAHRRLMWVLAQTSDTDARRMLLELEVWPQAKNKSAADSLLKGFEKLLTRHLLKVPALLCKRLLSTNPIESRCSLVSHSERNIKRSRGSALLQRLSGAVVLYCEQPCNRLTSFAGLAQELATIGTELAEPQAVPTKKARDTPMGASQKISTDILSTLTITSY